jgi:hypothetical protein
MCAPCLTLYNSQLFDDLSIILFATAIMAVGILIPIVRYTLVRADASLHLLMIAPMQFHLIRTVARCWRSSVGAEQECRDDARTIKRKST